VSDLWRKQRFERYLHSARGELAQQIIEVCQQEMGLNDREAGILALYARRAGAAMRDERPRPVDPAEWVP
jgi:hypothetical protein